MPKGKNPLMRYAIYFTPDPNSHLHKLGSSWLGRDAYTNVDLPQPVSELVGYTMDACRYGFHGTLKPPFRMKDSVSFASFEGALRNLANQHESFLAGPLELQIVDGFLALIPAGESAALSDLATDCVQQLDDFRMPPGEAELRRRRSVGLTDVQDALLLRWGYPYVLEEFRFHITLSSRLSEEDAAWMLPIAQMHFAPVLGRPLTIDAVTLLVEPDDGEDFVVRDRLSLIYNALKVA
jgi:putative phosphonate metabolism protein